MDTTEKYKRHSNIDITLKENIILATLSADLTNEDIALFNNEISNNINKLEALEEIHLDLRGVPKLPFFFIGSLLSIHDKIKPTELQIKNASPCTMKMLTEYELDQIFTIND